MNALTQLSTELTVLSETDRVRQQTNGEWLAEYNGTGDISKPALPQNVDPQPKIVINNQSPFLKSLKEAGIVSVRYVGSDLLITTDRLVTAELDSRIKRALPRLAEIVEPDTGESLYVYSGYRTFTNKSAYMAVMFRELRTGTTAERYFNIELKDRKGEYFKTGENGKFRIKGNIKRLQEGMFLKFWMDSVKKIPNDRPSQICRYMNSKLSGVVVSCPDSAPHHGITKLKKLKYEGHLYQIT